MCESGRASRWTRSAEFLQTPPVRRLRVVAMLHWLRVPGDTIRSRRTDFAVGAVVLGWFVLGLVTGWSLEPAGRVVAGSPRVEPARSATQAP